MRPTTFPHGAKQEIMDVFIALLNMTVKSKTSYKSERMEYKIVSIDTTQMPNIAIL
jgi:hypothetical protein